MVWWWERCSKSKMFKRVGNVSKCLCCHNNNVRNILFDEFQFLRPDLLTGNTLHCPLQTFASHFWNCCALLQYHCNPYWWDLHDYQLARTILSSDSATTMFCFHCSLFLYCRCCWHLEFTVCTNSICWQFNAISALSFIFLRCNYAIEIVYLVS